MIPRVLEPEVMDSAEEARDYDSMDHSAVNRVFVSDFLAIWNRQNPILDVGTGTAQIPIELCHQSNAASVVGVDLADHMLRVGLDNVDRAGFGKRIRLERIDAKGLPYANGQFAAVISNSIIHHIPAPPAVLAEMIRVVQTHGPIFVRDLLRPDTAAQLQNLVGAYAGDANPHQQKMFAESLHAALTLDEIRTMVSDLGCDPKEVRQTTDRHWTWATRKIG